MAQRAPEGATLDRLGFVQLGFGVDQHGKRCAGGATKAAVRACRNALEFNSIPGMVEFVPGGRQNMLVHVKLGVPPETTARADGAGPVVDLAQVAAVFPYTLWSMFVSLSSSQHQARVVGRELPVALASNDLASTLLNVFPIVPFLLHSPEAIRSAIAASAEGHYQPSARLVVVAPAPEAEKSNAPVADSGASVESETTDPLQGRAHVRSLPTLAALGPRARAFAADARRPRNLRRPRRRPGFVFDGSRRGGEARRRRLRRRRRGESPSSTDPKSFPSARRRRDPPPQPAPKPMLLRVLALAGVAAARPSACETPTEVEAGATFGITPAVGKETYDDGKTACWVLRADKSVTIGFAFFETEYLHDFVTIYAGDDDADGAAFSGELPRGSASATSFERSGVRHRHRHAR